MKFQTFLRLIPAALCGMATTAFAVDIGNVTLAGTTDSNNYTIIAENNGVGGYGTFTGTFDAANKFLISPSTATGPLTFDGMISGVNGIQVQTTGANPVIFNGANSFAGDLNLAGAWFRIGNATALGTTAGVTSFKNWNGQTSASYLDLNGQTVVGESLFHGFWDGVTNSQVLNSSASTATWTGNVTLGTQTRFSATGAGNLVISGNIADVVDGDTTVHAATIQVDASGGGKVVFSGSNTNTGAIVVANSWLVAGSAQAFGATDGATIIPNWGPGTWGVVDVNGQNIAGETFQNDAAGVLGNYAATNATWGGSVVGNAGSRFIVGGTGDLNITGVISGTTVQTDSGGGGTLVLSGNNTYTGDTIIYGAKVRLGHANALGTTAGVTGLNGPGSQLDLNGQSIVGETLINNQVNGYLFNSSATNASWSGNITANQQLLLQTTGAGSLELSGAISGAGGMQIQPTNGAVILSGSNTFAGAVNLNGATVKLGNANALGDTTGQTNMVGGDVWGNYVPSTLDLNGFTVTGETLNGGFTNSRLSNSAATGATWAGNIVADAQTAISSGAGGLTVSGAISGASSIQVDGGFVTLSGNNTYAGATVIANSRVFIGNANALGSTAGQTIIPNWGGGLVTWGAVDLNGFTVAGETLTFDTGGNLENSAVGAAAWNGNIVNNSWMVVRPTGGTLTVGGNITGAGGIGKSEASTAVFSGTNTYAGATNIDQGTLEIATGGSITSPGFVNIASAGTLKFSGGSVSINSGAGYIINNGGTVNVNGQTIAAGSYEASQMNAGAKLLNSSASAATILGWTGAANKNTVWINAAGVSIETVGDLNIASIVTDGGTNNGFTKTGAGTLTLSNIGNGLGSGNVTVSAGTLILSGGLTAGTVNVGSAGAIGGAGTLVGNLHLDVLAEFEFSLTNTLTVNGGSVSFDGLSIANIVGLDSSVPYGTYTLINGTAAISTANVSNFGAENAYDLGGGKYAFFKSGSLAVEVSPVPEPSTWALLAFSLCSVVFLRRRRTA